MINLTTRAHSARRLNGVGEAVAAAQTDAILVPAASGKAIRVTALFYNNVDAGVGTVTFKSKGGGAGTAISPAFQLNTKSGMVLPESGGWFETFPGEALAVDTAAASAAVFLVVYELES